MSQNKRVRAAADPQPSASACSTPAHPPTVCHSNTLSRLTVCHSNTLSRLTYATATPFPGSFQFPP